MTDSAIEGQPGKRERLVEGARRVFHEHGVQPTTLADIAEAANVPVGNVYYYFKTKDELVEAAIDAYARDIQAKLAEHERHRSPRGRLKSLAHSFIDMADLVSRYGCPQGSLCQELDKRDDGVDRSAAKLMSLSIDWAEEQFRLMGNRDARDLAVTLVANLQGACLVTNTFRDPSVLTRQVRRLERWIDSLA
jgi:TetR/AcrR family transcriptional repressor of nem operon